MEITKDYLLSIGWIDYTVQKPEDGRDVLAFNEKWKEDYETDEPNGIRIGVAMDGHSDFHSAKWCPYHDEYESRYTNDDHRHLENDIFPECWKPLV